MSSDHRAVSAIALVGAALLVAGCAGSKAEEATSTPDPGKVAVATLAATGPAQRCVPMRGTELRPADANHVMARSGANRWWRNELRSSCPSYTRDRTIVLRASTGQLCELDTFEVVDPVSRMSFGLCSLGQFTPVDLPKGTRF